MARQNIAALSAELDAGEAVTWGADFPHAT